MTTERTTIRAGDLAQSDRDLVELSDGEEYRIADYLDLSPVQIETLNDLIGKHIRSRSLTKQHALLCDVVRMILLDPVDDDVLREQPQSLLIYIKDFFMRRLRHTSSQEMLASMGVEATPSGAD